ncbi:DUF4433 domain-containing protein [Bacteroidetes/Chlorobi group bacterium MS-B_bin-24]|nr:MAG: DUF4433 domain-containing protein [Bacteroidetes/Chlorobi group bacterium MS-B_bin-24]
MDSPILRKAPIQILKENGIDYLYRITHKKNLKSILRFGLLSRNLCIEKGLAVEEIGDTEIKERRGMTMLPYSGLRLNDYVPLYFNPRNAMMYKVCKRFNASNLVVLAYDLMMILISGTIFTDANAASEVANFYYRKSELEKFDWKIIQSKDWSLGGITFREIKQKMMAEVLVKERIPRKYLKKLICNSLESVEDIKSLVKGKVEIEVSEGMFFY